MKKKIILFSSIVIVVVLSFVGILSLIKLSKISVVDRALWDKVQFVSELYHEVSHHDDLLEEWYFYENKNVTLDNLSNKQKLYMAFNNISEEDYHYFTSAGETSAYVDLEEIDRTMNKLFGNMDFVKEDIMPRECDTFSYNPESKQYVLVSYGCGGIAFKKVITEFYKAEEENDVLNIYEKFAFLDYEKIYFEGNDYDEGEFKTSGLYKDVAEEHLIKEINSVDETYNVDIKPLFNQLSMVKYTFKKGADNVYHFASSMIIE